MARRFMRRRRKPVEWVRVATNDHTVPFKASLHYDGTVAQVVDYQNIIIGDAPYAVDSLVEERKTYVIDRIVGRVEAQLTGAWIGGTGPTYFFPGPVQFRYGFFVGETDENGVILDIDRWDLFTQAGNEVDWIYRDSLMLGINESPASSVAYSGATPANMAAWCMPDSTVSRAPWGLVDTRAKRRVGQMERLMFTCAIEKADTVMNYETNPANVTVFGNLRVLLHWTAGTNKR